MPVDGNLTRPSNVKAICQGIYLVVSRQNVPYLRVETRLYLSLWNPQRFHFLLLEITRAQHTAHGTTETKKLENVQVYTKNVEKRIFSRIVYGFFQKSRIL